MRINCRLNAAFKIYLKNNYVIFYPCSVRLIFLAWDMLSLTIELTRKSNMYLANTIESQMSRPAMQSTDARFSGHLPDHSAHPHDPSPVISILSVFGCVVLLIGVNVFSAYQEHASKNVAREPAHNIPMVHMR